MKIGKLLSWAFWGGVALLAVYLIYAAIAERIALRQYGTYFAQVKHPSNTALVDSLSFSFSFYPATYIDENIDFVPVYLVGELRRYTGSWEKVEAFYEQDRQLEDGNYIVTLPLMIDKSEENTWVQVMDGVSYEPTDAAVIEELKYQYGWYGIPKNLNDTEQQVYLVYSMWWTPDDESWR